VANAERSLACAEANPSEGRQRAYPSHVADATPVQRQVIADYAARVRAVLTATQRRLGIAPPIPRASATLDARSELRHACVEAERLGARFLNGEPAKEVDRELNLTSATLIDLLEQMESYLAPTRAPSSPKNVRARGESQRGAFLMQASRLSRWVAANGPEGSGAASAALRQDLERLRGLGVNRTESPVVADSEL